MNIKNIFLAVMLVFTFAFSNMAEAKKKNHGKKASISKSKSKAKKVAKHSKKKKSKKIAKSSKKKDRAIASEKKKSESKKGLPNPFLRQKTTFL